jgi:hypothetical protein
MKKKLDYVSLCFLFAFVLVAVQLIFDFINGFLKQPSHLQ